METVEIPIKDAMTKNVKTVTEDIEVTKAAKIMEKNNIGCVVVVKEGLPVGIVTERDITYRVVAPNKKPSTILVKDIMSKPVETTAPDTTITQASKIMARQNLRRLPVIERDKLLGIITNTDIVQVAPSQIEILRELSRMRDRSAGKESFEKGTCENCGDHGVMLYVVNSSFVCDSCRDDMVAGERAKEGL
jgi:CBS domain-containing protein